ncbi:MAG: cyclic nucleotide-binding domain-containing protein [Mariprofundus sp.]|nr:cyclic nucleotide-binding domain-containing protein [Mariprofundus sp.]
MSIKKHTSPLNNRKQLQVYADLVQLYPDNEAYLKPYAELLLVEGKVATATEILRHLYSLWLKKGETSQADALVKEFPIIGRIRSSNQHQDDIQDFLPAVMRNQLWLRLHRIRLREGQHLLHYGEAGDSCYLVCEGELAEFGRGMHDKPIMLNLIGQREVVAEDKLLKPGIHKSDIIANKKSVVVKLPRKRMTAALLANPALKTILQRKADLRHMVSIISSSPVLQTIPLDMRRHLAEKSYIQQYASGSVIHKSGEQLNHVDLIVHGEACYQWNGSNIVKKLKSLKPGALIGETAAIHDSGCPADMVTHHGVGIVHIPYAVFINVVEAYPPLRTSLTAYAEEQRTQLMRKLNELQTQELNQR